MGQVGLIPEEEIAEVVPKLRAYQVTESGNTVSQTEII